MHKTSYVCCLSQHITSHCYWSREQTFWHFVTKERKLILPHGGSGRKHWHRLLLVWEKEEPSWYLIKKYKDLYINSRPWHDRCHWTGTTTLCQVSSQTCFCLNTFTWINIGYVFCVFNKSKDKQHTLHSG